MATKNEMESLSNKITLVDKNNIPLTDKDGNNIIVDQTLAIDPSSSHFFKFADKTMDERGSLKKRDLLTIDKKEGEEVYTLNFPNLSLFTTSDVKSLADELGIEGALEITPDQGGITISKEHGATCFKITASNGKTYTISTDATSVKITNENGDEFSFTSDYQNGIGIDASMNTDAVDAFFDKNNTIFQTLNNSSGKSHPAPKELNDFPLKNLALYARTFRGNNSKDVGDYTFITIGPIKRNKNDAEAKYPYSFISKTNSKDSSKKDNYFLINGKYEKLESMYLQYETVNGVVIPRIVIQVVPQKAGANTPNRRTYAFDLQLDENGNFIDESLKAIELLSNITGYQNKASSEANATDIIIGGFVFDKKDDRDYADYAYKLNPDNYNMVIDDDSDNGDPNYDNGNNNFVSPNNPDDGNNNIIAPNNPDIDNGNVDNGNGTEDPKLSNDPENPDNEEKEDDEDSKKETLTKSTKSYDFKKTAENFGMAIAVLGFFIGIGALITGVGAILAFVGMGIALVGTNIIAFKDKFEIKSFDIAYKRVSELEAQEDEDSKFAENFLATEKEIDNANENMLSRENELSNFITLSSDNANSFDNIFDNYGLGFSQDLGDENSISRFDRLMSIDGYEIRHQMLPMLQQIQQETMTNARNEKINNFFTTFFNDIPQSKKDGCAKDMFGENNSDYLNEFIQRMAIADEIETKYKALTNKQEERIAVSSDRQLSKIMNSQKVNSTIRENIFKRYEHSFVRRLSTDKNMNETKLDLIFKDVPNEEKADIFDKLINANENINSAFEKIENIAKENRESIANLQQASKYAKAMNDLLQDTQHTKFTTYNQASNSVKSLILNKTIYSIIDKINKDNLNIDINNASQNYVLNELFDKSYTEDCQNLINQIFNDFGDVINAPLDSKVPSGLIMPELKGKALNLKQGTIEDLISLFYNQKNNSMSEKAEELSDAYQQIHNKIYANIDAKTEVLCTKIIQDIANTFSSKLDSFKLDSETVKNKMMELQTNFNIDERISEKTLKNIARTILLADKAVEIDNLPSSTIASSQQVEQSKIRQENYKSTTTLLENVLNGNFFDFCFEKALVDACCNYSKDKLNIDVDKNDLSINSLQEQADLARQSIKGYHNTINLIDDLNLSTEHEDGQNSERQEMIEKIKSLLNNEDISKVISQSLKNKKITNKYGSITFDDIYKSGITDAGYDIKKVEKFINNQIEKYNHHSQIESHCYDTILGKKAVTKELKRQKSKHNKNKQVESKYDNVYDMILDLSKKKEDELENLILNNPKITPQKIAKEFGINKKQFKTALKEISNIDNSIDTQKELWLKRKDFKEYQEIADDFKLAWEMALKQENYQNLKALIAQSKVKKTKSSKKSIKQANIINDLASTLGLNLKKLESLLNSDDKKGIKQTINKLDKNGAIDKQIEASLTDKQNEISNIEIKKDILSDSDKQLLDQLNQLDEFNKDVEVYQKKISFFNSLAEKGVSENVIDNAIEAFAKGNTKFFEQQNVSIEVDGKTNVLPLLKLCEDEGILFEETDPILLKRLKISAKDLADSKNKKKRDMLRKINQNIQNRQQEQKEDLSKAHKKALESKKKTPFEEHKPKERNSMFKKLANLFNKAKNKSNNNEKDWLKSNSIKNEHEQYTGIVKDKEKDKSNVTEKENNQPELDEKEL